ncbi:MAG: MBL fold metallo-hydrolase [Candidatus Paceibacterota bacterium]
MNLNVLRANNGDCIHLYFNTENKSFNILIDGGPGRTYQFKNKKKKQEAGDLKKFIENLKETNQIIDLLILTHVDDDHIGGILKWFEKDKEVANYIKKVWFNSGRLISEYFDKPVINENDISLNPIDGYDTSIKQGATFENFIEEKEIWDRRIIKASDEIEECGATFTILSPSSERLEALLTKWKKEVPITDTSAKNDYDLTIKEHIKNDSFTEDKSIHNGSSIAFLLEYDEKKLIFLGDAHPQVIVDSLRDLGYSKDAPLQVEFLKISHHGSKGNTSPELLEIIDTNKFIISSNGDKHQLPDKQCLSRIINHNNQAELFFNYPELIDKIFSEEDHSDFPDFKAVGLKNPIEL